MNRLRRLLHRHRWVTLTVTIGPYKPGRKAVVVTATGCSCGEHRTTTNQGE